MYVEVIIEPGASEIQFSAFPDMRSLMHSAAGETRVVVFFTTPSESQAALASLAGWRFHQKFAFCSYA